MKHIKLLFALTLLVASNIAALALGERDVVKPIIEDKLTPVRLTHPEMAGGEIDRRIMDLAYKNFMVLNLDKDWLNMFKNRTDRSKGHPHGTYYGIGKVLSAGSLFAQYTGDPKVAERNQYIMDQLRSSRDKDGYIGFWNVEPNNQQNIGNFVLHEQEYLVLALVQNYRATGDPKALEDAKIMANYIVSAWPANNDGENYIPFPPVIGGMTEAMIDLYRVTGETKYLDFTKNVRFYPHVYHTKPYSLWESKVNEAFNSSHTPHGYLWLNKTYADGEVFRITGDEDCIKKNQWMKQQLLEQGRGMLLVSGSGTRAEQFKYDQDGSGKAVESCFTAYLLRWMDSMMRLEGDMRYGDVMERTIYNALFGAQSPNGRDICYFTPFTGQRRFQVRDCYCCNGNFRRGIVELSQKVYYRTSDGGIALNQFTSSDKTFDVKGKTVGIKQETSYPSSGEVKLSFTLPEPVEFAFSFRVPRWCEKVSVRVNDEEPIAIDPLKQKLGSYVLNRTWKNGDVVNISMPMEWRLVRGRAMQEGRVALLRGPVLFTISETLNKETLEKVPSTRDLKQFPIVDPKTVGDTEWLFRMAYQQARDLIIDPTSIGNPVLDDRIRPGGQKVTVKAWTNPAREGEQVDVVLTEFVDPDGLEVYFKVPNLKDTRPIRIMDDELLSELPRRESKPVSGKTDNTAPADHGINWEIGPPPQDME